MTAARRDRIGILTRGERRDPNAPPSRMFAPLARAFGALGIAAEPILYADDAIADAKRDLLRLGAALVWVDPIDAGRDRRQLDALLREVAAAGVWVSAHPDVILKMGAKEVLHRTRSLGWGADTRLYATHAQLAAELPSALSGGARVLKQNRGNGGLGVFRVELVERASGAPLAPDARVRVQHALRGSPREEMPLAGLLRRCGAYFADGCIVDQPLVPRHAEGMVRSYVVRDRVAGFGHQIVTALSDPLPGELAPPLPAPRVYFGPDKAEFQALRAQLESAWVPQLQALLGIASHELPALWDADFLLGPKTAEGDDSYVLCEINASSVFPFPEEALAPLARDVVQAARLG